MAEFNSGLRIRIPRKENIECTPAKRARMVAKAPPGWVVRKSDSTGDCYYYNPTTNNANYQTPGANKPEECSIQGGSKTRRSRRKSKTKKYRK